jgi:hypothetical protein
MLRTNLESYVIAWNTTLRETVSKMDYVILLRNAHPAYRDTYARLLVEAGIMTKDEGKEFAKPL